MWMTRNQIKIRFCAFPVKDGINRWFAERNIFFLLGIGRSGTKFFSELLNSDKHAIVFHEPIPEDLDAFCIAHKNVRNVRHSHRIPCQSDGHRELQIPTHLYRLDSEECRYPVESLRDSFDSLRSHN